MRSCDHPGCPEPGEHRAPRSRSELRSYYFFCLDHVREYNKSWNYYAGMSDDEVERITRFDTVWQRPTWPMGVWRAHEQALRDRLRRDFGLGNGSGPSAGGPNGEPSGRRGPLSEEEKALRTLDLDGPVDFVAVRARYKVLVKQHHPDANGGSKEAEETLKTINRAYAVLKAHFAS
ncbi:MAG: J domain-containing protein [Inquilinaceae bacterium]